MAEFRLRRGTGWVGLEKSRPAMLSSWANEELAG